jgi:hypothetical protein
VQLFRWNFHIEEERSVSTGHPRGNQVDGLPRATSYWHNSGGKVTSKVHADFPKILAQNLEYLAVLWSDLDEKLSSWS